MEATRKKPATPNYDPYLRAFHRAFASELRQIVQDLPLSSESRVLDLCCGDGFYTAFLAERLGADGKLVAADLSEDYLDRTRENLGKQQPSVPCMFKKADAYALPFDDASFDLAWCAQSFISLKEPVRALKEMRRVVRPGGVVAILESDEFHHLLLPWPVELELAVQRAMHAGFKERYGKGSKAAPARKLPAMLREAGLKPRRKKTYPADRQPPYPADAARFLRLHLRFLREVVSGHLPETDRAPFMVLTGEAGEDSFLTRPDADITCLNVLYQGLHA